MMERTYSSVGSLLLLVTLLVSGGLGLVRGLLLVVEGLPLLTEELANLAYDASVSCSHVKDCWRRHTELDARVVLADLVTLLVGEEHVRRETALGHVGVWRRVSNQWQSGEGRRDTTHPSSSCRRRPC